jgi:thiol:disulfide interchange protein DsbD
MFLILAVVIALVQAGGTQLGWGSQFQSAEFNLVMATLIFVFGLSLAGVFTIKPPALVTHAGEQLAEKEGLSGSFFKGALATVLGTPCVGPFLGPALGVAFTREWYDTIWIFLVVGVGMAIPYLLMLPFIMRLGRRERGTLSRKLQESKSWLVDFERVMAFLMFATVVYILHIFYGVVGGEALIWTLAFLVVVAFAAWLWGRMISGGSRLLPAAVSSVLVVVMIGGWLTLSQIQAFAAYFGKTTEVVSEEMLQDLQGQMSRVPTPDTAGMDPTRPILSAKHPGWEDFNIARLKYLTSQGTTVLIDFTADWCPNCKTNEAVALGIESTKQLASELGIVFMVADWTRKEKPDHIGNTLRALGYASIPLTAIFPGSNPNSPILLDGLFGPATLHERMREAVGVSSATTDET